MGFWQAFFMALPPTIMALAAFIQSIRNGRKTEEVHKIVNAERTIMQERIRVLEEAAKLLKEAAEKKG